MKPIKINMIVQQALFFLLFSLLVETMRNLVYIDKADAAFIDDLVKITLTKGSSGLFSVFIIGLLESLKNDISTSLGILLEYAVLWGVFYERCNQYHSLETTPKSWVIFLLIFSSILTISALIELSAEIVLLAAIDWKAQGMLFMPPVLMGDAMILLMPLWVAVQSGKALYKKFFTQPCTQVNG
jgi:hypothetical protein